MIKYILPILIAFCFYGSASYGQVYERIYEVSSPEVQQKMNENKMAGIAVLSNIRAQHTIGVAGISAEQRQELESLLSQHPEVLSFSIAEDAASVMLDTQAVFTRESFVQLTGPLNIVVVGYSATYSINE